jgi:SPASM domain peptide maturase of grasp-with-spasm system
MISKQLLKDQVRQHLHSLPVSFKFLPLHPENEHTGNFSSVYYKSDTITKLQTNSMEVGGYYKPISRFAISVDDIKGSNEVNNNNLPNEEGGMQDNSLTFNIETDKYFKLFAHCIAVKGASRSIICDLQRHYFHFIPNALYHILTEAPKTYDELILLYGAEQCDIITEYYTFLQQHEYGFYFTKEELDLFPPLSMKWQQPFMLSNCILDYNATSTYNIIEVLEQVEALSCTAIQLRFFSKQTKDYIQEILQSLHNSIIKSIDIIVPYSDDFTMDNITVLTNNCKRLNTFIIYNAPTNTKDEEQNNRLTKIIYTTSVINSETHCGAVQADYFSVNTPLFTESMHYNNCLHRKISIDTSGFIKNCPSLKQDFGHINNVKLEHVLERDDFKTKWSITKDNISVCRDCEFRYICTDCRAYTIDDNDHYAKPLKCSYNPYTAEWESTNT